MSETLNEWGESQEQDDRRALYNKRHRELSALMDYPPFSINLQKHNDYIDEILAYSNRIDRQIAESGEIEDRPFSTFMAKWEDDIEEAELYKKRYGKDLVGAQKAAAKTEGMKMTDNNIKPLGPSSAYQD